MASAAVAFTVDALAPQDAAPIELKLLLESKRATDTSNNDWQRVSEESLTLKNVHVITQLKRAQYAYRVSLRPNSPNSARAVAFPVYLTVPALSSISGDAEMCPPQIGTFAVAAMCEQLQCKASEQNVMGSTSASEAAVMLGGTLAAALLVYSLLPYMRAGNRKRRRSRSQNHSQTNKDRLRSISEELDFPSTPTTPNGASRRMWGSFADDGIEPAGAYRDGLRERKSRQPEANGSTVSDAGSELLLAKLPDFNGESGWRDFFDSEIYHHEPEEETRAAIKAFSGAKGGTHPNIPAKRSKLRQTTTAARGDRYRTIRGRIDQAAMEAALDDAQSFYEF